MWVCDCVRDCMYATVCAAQRLMDHLALVLTKAAKNLMTSGNLATCWAPTLLTPAEVSLARKRPKRTEGGRDTQTDRQADRQTGR